MDVKRCALEHRKFQESLFSHAQWPDHGKSDHAGSLTESNINGASMAITHESMEHGADP